MREDTAPLRRLRPPDPQEPRRAVAPALCQLPAREAEGARPRGRAEAAVQGLAGCVLALTVLPVCLALALAGAWAAFALYCALFGSPFTEETRWNGSPSA